MSAPSGQMGQGGGRNRETRKRNTMTNLTSKQQFSGTLAAAQSAISGGGLPTLDPAAVANYYGQLQTLQSQLTNQLAALKAQRVGLKGDARTMRSDVRAEGRGAIVEGVNSALERGMVGSSADIEQRIGGIADIKSGVTDVNRQLYDALAQNRLSESGAALAFEQGTQQLAAGAISQRMNLQAQELQNSLAIEIAKMQAAASAESSDAQMAMARAQLATAQQTARANRRLANNPMTLQDIYTMYPFLRPGAGNGGGITRPGVRTMGPQGGVAGGHRR